MNRKRIDAPQLAPESDSARHTPEPTRTDRSRVLVRAGRPAMMASAAVSLIVFATSCGKHASEHVAASSQSTEAVVASQPAPTANPLSPLTGPSTVGEAAVVTSADSLPPEVSVAGPDTLVAPGCIVELTAQGSPDVAKMVLSDGIGRKQPFAYDTNANVWRTFYRVPLKLTTERVELSVTATNDRNRWRRVWVFMNVDR
jgi:hypothetical protein